MRENKTCPDQGWQQMPTEELERILQAELEKEHPDEEVVLPILRELEERDKNDPVEMTPEVLKIAEKLSKYEAPSKQSIHKGKCLVGIAAAVAAVCIAVMAIPPTAQAESILDVLFRWTSSVFEFFTPEQEASNPPVEIAFETDHPGLRQLYDKVTELGATELVVPTWLPEGFVLTKLKEAPVAGGTRVFCRFENSTNSISFTYRISSNIFSKVEKEDADVEVFEFRKVGHFIADNNGNLSVTWTVDGVACVMNTNVPKEHIYTIIKSIYRSELA